MIFTSCHQAFEQSVQAKLVVMMVGNTQDLLSLSANKIDKVGSAVSKHPDTGLQQAILLYYMDMVLMPETASGL